MQAISKPKLPEVVKLYDRDNNLVETMKMPPEIQDWPRTVAMEGKLYREGGGEGNFYKLGEFAEVVDE